MSAGSAVRVLFFKPSGKFYASYEYILEEHGLSGRSSPMYEIIPKIKECFKYNHHSGMHMIVLPSENVVRGYPCMIPLEGRPGSKLRKEDTLTVTFDNSEKDIAALTVFRRNADDTLKIINQVKGTEATNLYTRLTPYEKEV